MAVVQSLRGYREKAIPRRSIKDHQSQRAARGSVKIRLGTRDANDILLHLQGKTANKAELAKYANSPSGVDFIVKKVKPERTRQQEKYYRKWCGEFAKASGLSPDKMHEVILIECFGSERLLTKFGEYLIARKRSGDTNVTTYGILIETLVRLAAFSDFVVPPPPLPEPIE